MLHVDEGFIIAGAFKDGKQIVVEPLANPAVSGLSCGWQNDVTCAEPFCSLLLFGDYHEGN